MALTKAQARSGQVAVSDSTPTSLGSLPDGHPCFLTGISVRNPVANTGIIYVGNSTVSTTTGYAIEPGYDVMLSVTDPKQVYAIAAVNNERLHWIGT